MMEEVFQFVATFKEFPPRSFPPSFNPANMLEDELKEISVKQKIERAFPMLMPKEGETPQGQKPQGEKPKE